MKNKRFNSILALAITFLLISQTSYIFAESTPTQTKFTLPEEQNQSSVLTTPTTDQEKALYDINNIIIGGINPEYIRQENFLLPDTGTYGALNWTSNNEDYITIDTTEGFNTIVKKPNRNQEAAQTTLTVTSTVNGYSESKDITLTIAPEAPIRAYPGAEGYGAYTKGGRDGQVYHVTNLNCEGEGSLAYGLEQLNGSKTIVFDVGGVIDLTDLGRAINISGEKYSNVTIAGQTAPYPGITLKGYGIKISNAHDVIMRNIRIRLGGVREDNEIYTTEPLSISACENVIIDHCSIQWAINMGFTLTGKNITISNSIFSKNLYENSPHKMGGHLYTGLIDEGSKNITFSKNLIKDSSTRNPRIVDSENAEIYNCLLYNCSYGIDAYNYEYSKKNVKYNIYNNSAISGALQNNSTPYRAGVGRNYSGGEMVYFSENYGLKNSTSLQPAFNYTVSFNKTLYFGSDNNAPGSDYDLSNITASEWDNNPISFGKANNNNTVGILTYMNFPFPAPRGDVINVYSNSKNNILQYALNDNGMGAVKPARDLYDTMELSEAKNGRNKSVTLSAQEVSPFFAELEKRTGLDYSDYKVGRNWDIKLGEGPILKGAATSSGSTKPIKWDNYTDLNIKTNSTAGSKYKYTTNFEIGDWWGEFCGSPGKQPVYTLYDNNLNRTITSTDSNYDQNQYELISISQKYIEVSHTVADLYPADWIIQDFPNIADFMNHYRQSNYADNDTSEKIIWDSMGDGIPDWYKEYKGWSTSESIGGQINSETGYTYLEEYLAFLAGDEPLESETIPATAQNFKSKNIGYSTAQIFWNTDYPATCIIDYGTEPGKYDKTQSLIYDEDENFGDTYHTTTLSGLSPETQYYYKITAIDEFGNTSVSEYTTSDSEKNKMTFSTAAGPNNWDTLMPQKPVIQNILPSNNSISIEWTGDLETDHSYELYYDTIDYGTEYEKYSNKITGIPGDVHKKTISGLTKGELYYFVVVGVNPNGKTSSDSFSHKAHKWSIFYDFPSMTEAEQQEFMLNQYFYDLGGTFSISPDTDAGYNCMQMTDESNTFATNLDIKFPYNQTEKFTFEIKMKILYQKQSDVLNEQNNNPSNMANNDYNSIQLNFLKNGTFNADRPSEIWEPAFSLNFDSKSTPITEDNGRFDGTLETGTLKFGSDNINTYKSGITPGSDYLLQTSFPGKTKYDFSIYKNNTKYGDAKYSNYQDTDRTVHSIWNYQNYSADFSTYKIVVDPSTNNIQTYRDGELIHTDGTFNENTGDILNVGKVQIKSSTFGFSWTSIESIKAYDGDEDTTPSTSPRPSAPPTFTPKPSPTATPEPTLTPGPTGTPSATPGPTATPSATPPATPEPTATKEPVPTIDPQVMSVWNFSSGGFEELNAFPANTEINGMTVNEECIIDKSPKTFNGSGAEYSRRCKISESSEVTFKVKKSCQIIIDAATSSTADREYKVYAGDELLGSFKCIYGECESYIVNYIGPEQIIKIVPTGGIGLYGVYAKYITSENEYEITSAAYNFRDLNVNILYHGSEDNPNATLIGAVYSKDDMLKTFRTLDIGNSGTYSIQRFVIDSQEYSDKVKIYVWDNLNSICPLSAIYEISNDIDVDDKSPVYVITERPSQEINSENGEVMYKTEGYRITKSNYSTFRDWVSTSSNDVIKNTHVGDIYRVGEDYDGYITFKNKYRLYPADEGYINTVPAKEIHFGVKPNFAPYMAV